MIPTRTRATRPSTGCSSATRTTCAPRHPARGRLRRQVLRGRAGLPDQAGRLRAPRDRLHRRRGGRARPGRPGLAARRARRGDLRRAGQAQGAGLASTGGARPGPAAARRRGAGLRGVWQATVHRTPVAFDYRTPAARREPTTRHLQPWGVARYPAAGTSPASTPTASAPDVPAEPGRGASPRRPARPARSPSPRAPTSARSPGGSRPRSRPSGSCCWPAQGAGPRCAAGRDVAATGVTGPDGARLGPARGRPRARRARRRAARRTPTSSSRSRPSCASASSTG